MYRCPLCKKHHSKLFFTEPQREYYQCETCALVFVPPQYYLSEDEEKSLYDLHQNAFNDEGYQKFLGRLYHPIQKIIKPNARGLDFGSGPTPVLASIFKKLGYRMKIYDHFYANEHSVFSNKYDFITATEVVEHLHDPRQVFEQLIACLQTEAVLAIMTKRVINAERFATWHYKNDPTHVCFFSIETFEWIAKYWGLTLHIIDNDVVFLVKSV